MPHIELATKGMETAEVYCLQLCGLGQYNGRQGGRTGRVVVLVFAKHSRLIRSYLERISDYLINNYSKHEVEMWPFLVKTF